MTVRLIGIDCATKDARVGLALGTADGPVTRIDEVVVCGRQRSAVDHIAQWLRTSEPALLALDAPLGWPQALSSCLTNHRAGDEVLVPSNDMFRRATDRFIQQHFGKTPLDVGADRIARTAHAALQLLGALRRRLDQPIPLAWSPQLIAAVCAIEVYPAATLGVRGIRSTRYKKPAQVDERKEIIVALCDELVLPADVSPLEQNADGLDAVVCVLCAKDFLLDHALPPENASLAAIEGWIWMRPPRTPCAR